MTVAHWDDVHEDAVAPYGMLRGLANAEDPLRLLGAVLTAGQSPEQRRWMIDNRAIDTPLKLEEMAEFVLLAGVRARQLTGASVAWVTSAPWDLTRQQLAQQLPFPFRCFQDIDEAHDWLLGRLPD
jgi:hypothetical protein